MLAASIGSQTFAQESADKIFDQPVNASRMFTISLDKGNKVQIELADINDIEQLYKCDSLFGALLKDIEPLQDSLSDELAPKRVDYLVDTAGIKKIRIQQYKPKGANYLVKQGDIASLKLEQDTVNYIGMVSNKSSRKNAPSIRFYRMSFLLNDIRQLPSYLNRDVRNKIVNLKSNIASKWVSGSDGQMHLQKDNTISAKAYKGYSGSDFVALSAVVNIQNYKHYFVPSFSIGAAFNFSNSNRFTREIGLFWEPQFLFAKNSEGKLQTFRNDFLTLTLAQGLIKGNDAKRDGNWLTIMSFGYMIKRSGDYYDKNTWRIGAGRLSLNQGKIKIEPAFYFNNFFKGVSPSVRLTVGF